LPAKVALLTNPDHGWTEREIIELPGLRELFLPVMKGLQEADQLGLFDRTAYGATVVRSDGKQTLLPHVPSKNFPRYDQIGVSMAVTNKAELTGSIGFLRNTFPLCSEIIKHNTLFSSPMQ